MLRRTTRICLSVLIAGIGIGTAPAEEPHVAMWKFLEGDWTYRITPGNVEGTATWRLDADGRVLLGRFVDGMGTGIEISGWRSDIKTNKVLGFGSSGMSWQFEITKFSPDTWEGAAEGVTADAQAYKGTAMGRKIGNDRYEWRIIGKLANGDDYTETGTATRKREAP